MSGTVKYEIGSHVSCTDADCGRLALVVVDPVAAKLAHLIVMPHGSVDSRLVPVGMAHPTGDRIELDCTLAEFGRLEPAVRTHFMPAADPQERWGYRHDQIVSWPFFGLGPTGPNSGLAAPVPPPAPMPDIEFEDRVPAGEVRIYPGDRVHAADGDIGRVRGLVVDPADESVTHVLLDEGHLWGRKRVAIPMAAVGGIDADGVSVRLSKDEIKDLPPVEIAGLG